MNKELVVEMSKFLLELPESELINCLAAKPEVLRKAISRGKDLKRVNATISRQSQRFDRWNLYEALKGNKLSQETILYIESMSSKELREGCLEFLTEKAMDQRQEFSLIDMIQAHTQGR